MLPESQATKHHMHQKQTSMCDREYGQNPWINAKHKRNDSLIDNKWYSEVLFACDVMSMCVASKHGDYHMRLFSLQGALHFFNFWILSISVISY